MIRKQSWKRALLRALSESTCHKDTTRTEAYSLHCRHSKTEPELWTRLEAGWPVHFAAPGLERGRVGVGVCVGWDGGRTRPGADGPSHRESRHRPSAAGHWFAAARRRGREWIPVSFFIHIVITTISAIIQEWRNITATRCCCATIGWRGRSGGRGRSPNRHRCSRPHSPAAAGRAAHRAVTRGSGRGWEKGPRAQSRAPGGSEEGAPRLGQNLETESRGGYNTMLLSLD